jgi:hypothetical protein
MQDAHILKGDLAVIRVQSRVEKGKIAAVMVRAFFSEVTLRASAKNNPTILLVFWPVKFCYSHRQISRYATCGCASQTDPNPAQSGGFIFCRHPKDHALQRADTVAGTGRSGLRPLVFEGKARRKVEIIGKPAGGCSGAAEEIKCFWAAPVLNIAWSFSAGEIAVPSSAGHLRLPSGGMRRRIAG